MSGSLKEAFEKAQKLFENIEHSTLESRDKVLQQQVSDCITEFTAIEDQLRVASVFSRNEDIDDLKTWSIKYLLVPYYMGELGQKIINQESRLGHLKEARLRFTQFLLKCRMLNILSEEEHEGIMKTPLLDRQQRIDNRRKQKEVNAKLAELCHRRKKLKKSLDQNEDDVDDEYDEVERQYQLLNIDQAIRNITGQLRILDTEMQLLGLPQEQKDEMLEEYKAQQQEAKENPPSNLVIPAGGAAATLREQLTSEVFKPVNQATIMPEEWFDQNKEEIMRNAAQPQQGDQHDGEKSDEDNDEKLKEKRQWDEFKDTHPTGWGNRKGNIG